MTSRTAPSMRKINGTVAEMRRMILDHFGAFFPVEKVQVDGLRLCIPLKDLAYS